MKWLFICISVISLTTLSNAYAFRGDFGGDRGYDRGWGDDRGFERGGQININGNGGNDDGYDQPAYVDPYDDMEPGEPVPDLPQ